MTITSEVNVGGSRNLIVEVDLKECPFCGSVELELANTHTPSYWVECLGCGAQASGESFYKKEIDHYSKSAHKKAQKSACEAWNMRVSA